MSKHQHHYPTFFFHLIAILLCVISFVFVCCRCVVGFYWFRIAARHFACLIGEISMHRHRPISSWIVPHMCITDLSAVFVGHAISKWMTQICCSQNISFVVFEQSGHKLDTQSAKANTRFLYVCALWLKQFGRTFWDCVAVDGKNPTRRYTNRMWTFIALVHFKEIMRRTLSSCIAVSHSTVPFYFGACLFSFVFRTIALFVFVGFFLYFTGAATVAVARCRFIGILCFWSLVQVHSI